MLIIKRLKGYGSRRPGSVVTLGVFDGVHRGHQALISRLVGLARKLRHDSVVVTFDPPPQSVLNAGRQAHFLTSLEEKEKILGRSGVDALALIKFTDKVADLEAEEFVREVLVCQLRASHVICGSDCGFGRGRSGNLEMLRRLGLLLGFRVTELKPKRSGTRKISSSSIKDMLGQGRVVEANRMLGRPYTIAGTVVRGQGLGRKLGYPTVNIRPFFSRKLIPAGGVYAAVAEMDGKKYRGLLYIGRRPTVSKQGGLRIEFHALGNGPRRNPNRAELALRSHLRADRRFDGLEGLRSAIGKDVLRARMFFGRRRA